MSRNMNSVDDVISMMHSFLTEVNKNISGKGLDEASARNLAEAKDPDEVFKARLVSMYMEEFVNIRTQLSYLMQPVTKEGTMQQKLNGTVELDGESIPEGTRFEYFMDNAWHYGILRLDRNTKKYCVANWKGDVELERVEQLKARVRG